MCVCSYVLSIRAGHNPELAAVLPNSPSELHSKKSKQHNIVTVRQGTGLAFLLPSLPSRSVLENPFGPNQPENLHKDRSSRPPGWAGGSGWCGIKRLTNLFCPAAHSLSDRLGHWKVFRFVGFREGGSFANLELLFGL